MKTQKFVFVCLVFATAIALTMAVPGAQAAATVTGTWDIHTYSGANQTSTFSYPDTVNATLQPLNITVSGQRYVSITDATNSSHVYFSTSIGFYPVGSNFTTGKVNVSWAIPVSLASGATLSLAVGLSGVKTPESFVLLTVKQNFTSAVLKVIQPFIAGFQNQLTLLQQKLDQANAQLADQNFRSQQIEAVEGIAIACLAGYIVYERRKKAGQKEEFQRAAGEFEGVVIATAVENAEPGEKAALEGATIPKEA